MMSQFTKGLVKCDLFGQTITLRMNKQNFYKTAFGGCVSLVLFITMLLIFSQNLISFLNKENLTATVLTTFEEFPSLATLNDNTFAFAIQIEQSDFIQNPYFNIQVEQKQTTRFLNGSKIENTQNLILIPCTLDRFTNIFSKYDVNITKQFYDLDLQNFLCFDYNSTFTLQGTNSNQQFLYLKISVNNCVPNKQCATETERQNEIEKNGSFKLKLYTVNQILNPQNPDDQYLQTFIDDSFYLKFLPQDVFKTVDIFLKEYEVLNDLSLTPFSDIQLSKFYILDQSEVKERLEFQSKSSNDIATLYFRKSPYKTTVYRSYLKIDELLSNLGGIQQIFFFFLGIILSLYNRFQCIIFQVKQVLVELANKLYEFSLIHLQHEKVQEENLQQINHFTTEKQDDLRTHRLTEQDLEIKLVNPSQIKQKEKNGILKFGQKHKEDDQEEINYQDDEDRNIKEIHSKFQRTSTKLIKNPFANKIIPENGLQYFKQQIITIINRSQPVLLSFSMIINFITCNSCCSNKKHIQLMNKAIDQITDQIDLFNILTKLNELEKIKEVIFTPEQLMMFNFTPKPMISLDMTKKTINRSYFEQRSKCDLETQPDEREQKKYENRLSSQRGMHLRGDAQLYQDIYNAYDEVLQDQEENIINKQLIKKLGPEVQAIFKLSKFIDQSKLSARSQKRKKLLNKHEPLSID